MSIQTAMQALAEHLETTPEQAARSILERAAEKVLPTLKQLLDEYKMKDRAIKLIGGGGGAGAIVPFVAEQMGLPFEIARHAEVISAIGAALAMVRETIEKNMLNPTESELAGLRAEAEKAVVKMGAEPSTVQVTIEIDAQRNIVRATATGSVEFAAQDLLRQESTEEDRLITLKTASPREESYEFVGRTDFYFLYRSDRTEKALFNLIKKKKSTVWLTDGKGNVKLQVPGGQVQSGPGQTFDRTLETVLERFTSYGDAGAQIPPLSIVAGRKVLDMTALQTAEQVKTLARQELNALQADDPVYFLIHPHA